MMEVCTLIAVLRINTNILSDTVTRVVLADLVSGQLCWPECHFNQMSIFKVLRTSLYACGIDNASTHLKRINHIHISTCEFLT